MPSGKNTRLQQWLHWRIRVTIQDARMLVGNFMAFDRHMNLVISDCEEFRKVKVKGSDDQKEIKRSLGFVMLRGENIISVTAEAPPPAEPKKPGEGPQVGPGRGMAAGRGIPMAPMGAAPPGLAGPVRGVGGPAPQFVRPPGMPPPGMTSGGPPQMGMRMPVPPQMGSMPPGMMMGHPPPGVPRPSGFN
eukprot:GHVL01003556.1.p1 GENE.GHVL01003556.1~~GHVL01003556.1.p1  ORF type:complete len:189 (-),score=41.52 GHVL01003556.1:61-627(-)